ncbi:CheR family methyltransferase [Roseomonas xinghualingensis]|uniref:CheR family methyltransferase n=1 Tax=Roseomonas xinghualingensis TaxID=2986475 RepID=UPI0021F14180|nr:CheR family methyltransferase [Roseomonas sp. SXEYE001]MCV4208923.1 hypothetical protein [Roseomonas sp. SXEYE001]
MPTTCRSRNQEASPGAPIFGAVEAGLGELAGLAPSEVLRRRLERAALLLAAIESPPGLASPGWAALLDAVTVQETRLFRAAPQLLALSALLPELPGRPLRLLSAGCASGEEAWSLAILAAKSRTRAEVLGLDLCRPALATAEAGRYPAGPPDALREVPDAFRPWFIRDGGWVVPRFEDLSRPRFLRANLLAPPEEIGRFGAILCRNVLIYLLPAARDAVLRGLVARLLPGGALLLGPTDSPPAGLPLRPEPGAHGIWRRS